MAAGAFAAQHAFTAHLAAGRPNQEDMEEIKFFADSIYEKVNCFTERKRELFVSGDAAASYYVPKRLDGEAAKFLKAKPKTDPDNCIGCGICAQICPMGAIDPQDVFRVPGTCIKCHACIRACGKGAKYFDDADFLSHVAMLEKTFAAPKKNELFF